MDVKLTTNATLSLLNMVARADSDPVVDTTTVAQDAAEMTPTYASDMNTLMIRDELSSGAYVYGFVNMSNTELTQLGSFLVDIRDKELALATETVGTAAHTQLVSEKQTLETNMSLFIADKVHMDEFDMQAGISTNGLDNSFFDILEINGGSGQQDELKGLLSIVEVELDVIFQNAHHPATCPHCQAMEAAKHAGSEVQAHNVGYNTSTAGASAASAQSDSDIETLRMGSKWNVTGSDTLSYSFLNSSAQKVANYNNNPGPVFTSLADVQDPNYYGSDNHTGLREVMAAWDKAVDFDFTEITETVGGSDVGEIRIAFTDGGSSGGPGGRAAFAYGPGSSYVNGDVWFEADDIDVSGDSSDFDSTGTGDDGFSYFAALHEVGHAIGLSHPFGGSAGGATLSSDDDTIRNTVMSYTQIDRNMVVDFAPAPSTSSAPTYRVYSSTPMIMDVKAVEYLYGAESVSDGDSTYTFTNDSTRLQPIMMKTLIDSGGNDTIDASNQSRANTINLNPGTFSTIGLYTEAEQISYWQSARGFTSSSIQTIFTFYDNQAKSASNSGNSVANANRKAIYTGEDNLAIAHNAQIENAIGGSAADTITGNSLDNAIEGRGGNDTLNGGTGDDALTGGAGDDTIDGGVGTDTGILTGSSDQYSIDYTNYDKSTKTGTIVVTDSQSGRDGTDTFQNVEFLKFSAGEASTRGAQVRTDSVTASDMTGTHQIGIEVDGGAEVTVTFTGRDYSTLGLSAFAADMQTAINAALAADGQSSTVTVTVNSPLTITSDDTSSNSAVTIGSLSLDLQAALGTITQEGAISVGDVVYYNLGGGYVTTYAPLVVPTIQTVSGTSNPGGGSSSSSPSQGSSGGGSGSGGAPGTGSTSQPSGNGLGGTGLPNLNNVSVLTQEDTVIAIQTIDRAINQISQNQARLGAIQNRMQHNIDNLMSQVMQTESARGRIVDADFASETAKLMKDQILQQAAMQAMNMALNSKQGVMGLLG